ncbi:MAG: DUF5916 domain-containing protein [Candidatus Cloacimonetes bacterium]|nr:DUF5916 domain-containing protein [Candidatus Cloacimonadota bacterium]
MRRHIVIFIMIVVYSGLGAFVIPYSEKELRDETNHLTDFVRISPDDSAAMPLQTDVWLWHDCENLYVLSECEINDNFDEGRVAAPDEWVEGDFFRIQIITDVKNYYAYMFYTYPLGNHYDCIRKSNMNTDTGWNSDYRSESSYSDSLWKSVMTIPFKDLRFWGSPPYNWKIILTRYFQEDETFYSLPYGTIEMGKDYYRTAYDVTLNEEIARDKNYKIAPYFVKKYDLVEKEDSFDPDNIGLDFSYNPTSATKLKLSFNPDFSDIPMDNVENNYNSRYEPSFEENRYFFIEDLDVFGVEDNLFYSRHIRQPQYAVKLTGNTEHFSYGFLSAMDKEVKENGEVLFSDDIYNMLAFKPKWKDLHIQMTLLNRMNEDCHNEVLVINPSWEFRHNQSLWCELDVSYKDSKEIEVRKGYTLNCGYNGEKGDFDWSLNGTRRSEDFDADMGLVYIRDFTAMNATISYDDDPDGEILKKYGSGIWYHKAINNDNNAMFEENGGVNFWFNSTKEINFSMNVNLGKEEYKGTFYNWGDAWINLNYWGIDWLSTNISYSPGKSVVYNLEQESKKDYLSISLRGDVSNHVTYFLSASRQRYFDFPDSCGVDEKYWIANMDITINFTNHFSLRNGCRYNDYEIAERTGYLGFFSNLSYEFKDQCFIYLGYKTVQDEIEAEYIVDYRQAYVKVKYSF